MPVVSTVIGNGTKKQQTWWLWQWNSWWIRLGNGYDSYQSAERRNLAGLSSVFVSSLLEVQSSKHLLNVRVPVLKEYSVCRVLSWARLLQKSITIQKTINYIFWQNKDEAWIWVSDFFITFIFCQRQKFYESSIQNFPKGKDRSKLSCVNFVAPMDYKSWTSRL